MRFPRPRSIFATRTALVTVVASIAMVAATLPAANANDVNLASGGNPPGGWVVNPEDYQQVFGNFGEGAPQGTVIADSGFRPYPHGFPVPNWGSAESFAENTLVFGGGTRVTLEQLQKIKPRARHRSMPSPCAAPLAMAFVAMRSPLTQKPVIVI